MVNILIWLVIIGISFIILYAVAPYKQERVDSFYEAEDNCGKALDSSSAQYVKDSISELKTAYQVAAPYLPSISSQVYETDIEDLRDHLHDLEMDKWQRKADKYLQEFSDQYFCIVSQEFESFDDVELLFRTKTKCMNAWKKYFSLDLSQYETTICPKEYLKEWMDDDYDPCMESHDALEKKLSEYVEHMRPEYKRKTRLNKLIVNHVRECESIKRADLWKVNFEGFTKDEVRCCYRALIKKKRLVEIKMGDRFFVYLSDSELKKLSKE